MRSGRTRPAMLSLLERLDSRPVLVDVGASGAPPDIWSALAPASVYVGFDPDRRELDERAGSGFHRSVIVNEAVTSRAGEAEARFHFTRSPFCSSTLLPDAASLSHWLFADLFTVERTGTVRAATLDAVLDRLGLARADWLKVDSQGTDLRIFESLGPSRRERVIALDLEPGLIDAYAGEDLFVDAHRALTRGGFWLSRLEVHGTVRVRPASLAALAARGRSLTADGIRAAARNSPGWVEARYLRTLDSIARVDDARRDLTLLWGFALLDGQPGYALDTALEAERRFGADSTSAAMIEAALIELAPAPRVRAAAIARALLPRGARAWLRSRLASLLGS